MPDRVIQWTGAAALSVAVHQLAPGDPWSFGWFEARRLACEVEDVLASALFGWLP